MVGINVREKGNDGQCPSVEERERAKNKISRIAFLVGIAVTNTYTDTYTDAYTDAYTCNGTPGWRRVAFVNMTETSYTEDFTII